jgi:hypothetical protein
MSRFLAIAIFLIIALGLVLHTGMETPWYLDWIGQLPGDLIIRKGSMSVYAPVMSSVLLSAVLSVFFSLLFPNRK